MMDICQCIYTYNEDTLTVCDIYIYICMANNIYMYIYTHIYMYIYICIYIYKSDIMTILGFIRKVSQLWNQYYITVSFFS